MELSEAAKEKQREYARQYYARYPEKRKKWTNDYWERKAEKEKAKKDESKNRCADENSEIAKEVCISLTAVNRDDVCEYAPRGGYYAGIVEQFIKSGSEMSLVNSKDSKRAYSGLVSAVNTYKYCSIVKVRSINGNTYLVRVDKDA